MSVVTFCGHRDFYGNETVKRWLRETVEMLIARGADEFLLGGYGGFDACAASVVWELKWKYPAIHSTLVLPYLDQRVDATKYDGTLYPALEKVPRRYAISKRNEYMVSSSVMNLLKRWREEQTAAFSFLGVTPSGYVMTTDDGQPMHPDSPTDWLAKLAKRHGLPPIHPHKFRHTQASLLISEGVDILTVSKRLGHAKVSTTLDIYSHVLAKSDQQASDTLDDLLFKKKEG